MREKVLIHPIRITRNGERRTFEVKIPRDVIYLIGFETTLRVIFSPVPIPMGGEPPVPPIFPNLADPGNGENANAGEDGMREGKVDKEIEAPALFIPDPPPALEPVNDFLVFKPTIHAGDLRIMSSEEANIFYATEVNLFDNNLHHGNPIVVFPPPPAPLPEPTFAIFFAPPPVLPPSIHDKEYTHGYRMEEDRIKIDGDTTVIKGYYRDRLGEYFNADIQYIVNLYIWYERT